MKKIVIWFLILVLINSVTAVELSDIDFNNDNTIDLDDILDLITDFRKTSDFDIKHDVNMDNKVDLFDIVMLVKNLGKTYESDPCGDSVCREGETEQNCPVDCLCNEYYYVKNKPIDNIQNIQLFKTIIPEFEKSYLVKTLSTEKDFFQQPRLVRLNNGDFGVVFISDDWTTISFQTLYENTKTDIFYKGYNKNGIIYNMSEDSDYKVYWPTIAQKEDDTLLVVFAYVDVNTNEDKSVPSNAMLRVFESKDYGTTWNWKSDITSKPTDDDWQSLWQPNIIKSRYGADKIYVVATEQWFGEQYNDITCDRSIAGQYRDDTVVLLKSFNGGETWPYNYRYRIYVGPCGADNNEADILELSDGRLMVVIHSKDDKNAGEPEGHLKITTSDDNVGTTWSDPELIVRGDYPIDNRKPELSHVNDKLILQYTTGITKRVDWGFQFKNPVKVLTYKDTDWSDIFTLSQVGEDNIGVGCRYNINE